MKSSKRARVQNAASVLPLDVVVYHILPRVPYRYLTDVHHMRLVCRAARDAIDEGNETFWARYGEVNLPGMPDARKVMNTLVSLMGVCPEERKRRRHVRVFNNRLRKSIQFNVPLVHMLPRLVLHTTFLDDIRPHEGDAEPSVQLIPCVEMWGSVLLMFPTEWNTGTEHSHPMEMAARVHLKTKWGLVIWCRAGEDMSGGNAFTYGYMSLVEGASLWRCQEDCRLGCNECVRW
jgi:hypothetical protein